MKTKIRILMALIGVCLLVAMVCAPAASAAATANISFTVDKSEVNVGDTITVVISNNDLTAEGFGLYLEFDNSLVECTGLTGCYDDSWMGVIIINSRGREADADADYSDTVELTNSDGIYSFAYMPLNDTEILAGTVATLTFTAKAEGVVTFALSEQTSGTDEYSGIADTKTVTIGSTAPSCDHSSTKLVPNEDGTHNVVCANAECGQTVTPNVPCTGTDDDDCTTAVTCACTNVVTAAKDAHVAGEDDGDCTTAVKCVNCEKNAVAAKEHSYTTKDSGRQSTPANCTNAAQNYVQCDNCNAVSKDKTVAVGEPNGHGKVDGFRLYSNYNGTHDVICNDCDKATEENVTCTVDESQTTYGEGRPANCCEAGLQYKYTYCACGYEFGSADITIPATGDHTLVKYEKEAATCTTSGHEAYWMCDKLGFSFTDAEGENMIEDFFAWISEGGKGYIPEDPTNHTGEVKYVDNGDNTHSATYDCCGAPFVTNEAHDYTTSPAANTCICGAVKAPDHACVAAQYKDNGDGTHDAYCTCDNTVIDNEPHIYGEKHACQCGAVEPTGWVEIEGAWYYVYEDYTKATGLSRVPYPTVEIMGNTYAPNAADIAYAESKGRDFIDATEAWFLFEDDGKFAYDSMGYVDHGDSQGKLINGMLPWHIGLVEVAAGEYRYFAGDLVNGGNVIATGKIYVSRNTTDLDVVIGGIYLFDENGALVTGDGITDVDGVLYYLEDNRVAIEAGLIEIDGSYYYVRSGGESAKAGQVVVGRKYWVSDTNGLLAAGMYEFDENGKMVIDPTVNANGIVEIDGVYYYYKAGVKQVGAGVVEMTDELGETFYIYVKSDGTLATGEYWPTTTNGLLERGCYDWGTDGRYYPAN